MVRIFNILLLILSCSILVDYVTVLAYNSPPSAFIHPIKVSVDSKMRLSKFGRSFIVRDKFDVPPKSFFRLSMAANSEQYYQGKDAYQILEIPRESDSKQIKSAYRKLVSTWHPDKFPDDEAKKQEGGIRMEAINRAYFCLGDEDRRRRYDQYGEAGVGTSAASEEKLKAAGGPGMGGFGGGQVDVGDISDIFESFFGGSSGMGGGRRQQQRNPNAPVPGNLHFQYKCCE